MRLYPGRTPGPGWAGCGGLSPPRPPQRTGSVLLAAPEKARPSLGRKHKSEVGTMLHCGAVPQPRGAGIGMLASPSPAPSCAFSCRLSPWRPRDPPGLATALAAGSRGSHPAGSSPAFSSAPGGKGEPRAGPTASTALWPPARCGSHTSVLPSG